MPNGISCAYFAVRNHLYGQKESNIFKEGIAAAQTTRTVDAVAQAGAAKGAVSGPAAKFFGKAAKIARKIVYPLIIGSGIYNTVKADDKVRTGASQGAGIAAMYLFEQTAEKGLNSLNKAVLNTNLAKNNKYARAGVYILKGLGFVAASLTGYNAGSKAGEIVIDKFRDIRQSNKDSKQTLCIPSNMLDSGEDRTQQELKEPIFEDIVL